MFDNVIFKILEVCERLSVRKFSSSESFTVRVCVCACARLSLLQLANRIGNEAKPRACITAEQCPAVQLFTLSLALLPVSGCLYRTGSVMTLKFCLLFLS